MGTTKEIPVDRLEFQKGVRDYQTLVSSQDLKPSIIMDGKEYLLERKTLKGGNLDGYLRGFNALLQPTEEREDGDQEASRTVHLNEERYGHQRFLPITNKSIRTQLFGFGWAALEAKDLKTAFPSLKAAEVLNTPEVVQRFIWLGNRDKLIESFLRTRREWEKAHIISWSKKLLLHPSDKDFGRSLEKTKRALKALDKIITNIILTRIQLKT